MTRRPPPALPTSMKPWEHKAAHVGHVLLYACMLALPVTDEVPATALKNHDDVTVLADEEALSDVD